MTAPPLPRRDPWRSAMLWLMVMFYGAAGVVHLSKPGAFLPIVPDWVPAPLFVVLFTGLCEVAGAAGLLTQRFRRLAGIMLALYAICVFPANIKHAIEGIQLPQLPSSWWYHGPRLLAQPVLVWWALYCSGVVDWPFGRRLGPDQAIRTSRPADHANEGR